VQVEEILAVHEALQRFTDDVEVRRHRGVVGDIDVGHAKHANC
jgi:hypothetical protein